MVRQCQLQNYLSNNNNGQSSVARFCTEGNMNFSEVEGVPRYGVKRKLNHKYPERRDQNLPVRLQQLWVLLPLIIR